jgi:hypothetical protein
MPYMTDKATGEKKWVEAVLHYRNDGQPIRRVGKKERMSKKERLRERREEKALAMKSAEELRQERKDQKIK